jgi:hypothetical protein
MAWGEPLVGGDDELAIDKIQSSDFVTGLSGWRLGRDGIAELNDLIARGKIIVGPNGNPQVVIDTTALEGFISFPTYVASEDPTISPPTHIAAMQGFKIAEGAPAEQISLRIHGGENWTVGRSKHKPQIALNSEAANGATPAQAIFQIIDTNGNNVNDSLQPDPQIIVDKTGSAISNYRRPMFKFSGNATQAGLARNTDNKVALNTTIWNTETNVLLDTVNNQFNFGIRTGFWRVSYTIRLEGFSGVNLSWAETWISVNNATGTKYGYDANPIAVNSQVSVHSGTDLIEATAFADTLALWTRYQSSTAGAAYQITAGNVYPTITLEWCRTRA